MRKRMILWCVLVLLGIICIFIFAGCYQQREYVYYSDESNFVSITAELSFLNIDEENGVLYMGFRGLPDIFSDNTFKITGENWKIIEARGGGECFVIGEQLTFVTAPRYFGDGYVMPIVALSTEEETLLEYKDGYNNFMDLYNTKAR